MIEQKLIPGRFIDLQVPMITPPAFAPGSFVTLPPVHLKIRPSTVFFTKTSIVDEGVSLIDHRDFNWLAWLSGAISQVPLGRKDVLTGPMSGCWLVIYRTQPGGIVHVGHIGTDIASPAASTAAKAAWNTFARANPANVIAGFNPLDYWPTDQLLGLMRPGEGVKIFGLLTANQRLYSIVTFQQGAGSTLLRITAVSPPIASAPIAVLQNL